MNRAHAPVRGYAALLSTIIICAALSAFAYQTGAAAYQMRLSILEKEYATQGRELAYSCAQAALYMLASDISYRPRETGDKVMLDSTQECWIESIESTPRAIRMIVHAQTEGFYSALEIVVEPHPENTTVPFLFTSLREI